MGGGGGIVCGAVLDAGQGDGVGWRVLFWCCVAGVVGALWFVLGMRAIGKCAGTHRDAAFEWLAAWALVCDLIMLIASLMGDSNALVGASNDGGDAGR